VLPEAVRTLCSRTVFFSTLDIGCKKTRTRRIFAANMRSVRSMASIPFLPSARPTRRWSVCSRHSLDLAFEPSVGASVDSETAYLRCCAHHVCAPRTRHIDPLRGHACAGAAWRPQMAPSARGLAVGGVRLPSFSVRPNLPSRMRSRTPFCIALWTYQRRLRDFAEIDGTSYGFLRAERER
jgi:hypothetical protein